MNSEDRILNRIDRLLEKGLDKLSYTDGVSYVDAAEISLAATDIVTTIYGTSSPQLIWLKRHRRATILSLSRIICTVISAS